MYSKFKILAGIYFVFTAILACRCPEPNHFTWETSEFTVTQNFNETQNQMLFNLEGNVVEINEKISFNSILNQLGPSKAHALQKCESELYYLATEFSGISIKSDGNYSIDEPAGTELKSHFKFLAEAEDGGFDGVMNHLFDKKKTYPGLQFSGELTTFPTLDSVHVFTYTFYLTSGDSLITVAEPFNF